MTCKCPHGHEIGSCAPPRRIHCTQCGRTFDNVAFNGESCRCVTTKWVDADTGARVRGLGLPPENDAPV